MQRKRGAMAAARETLERCLANATDPAQERLSAAEVAGLADADPHTLVPPSGSPDGGTLPLSWLRGPPSVLS